jgi:MFS family permease
VLPRQRRRASGGPRTSVRDLVGLAVSGPVLPATLSVIVGAATLAAIDVVVPLDADERLGLMAAAIGGLFAVTIALDAAAAPIAGRWSDRVGRVPVALLGLALLAASLVLLAILPGVGGLLTGLSVFGVGSSVLFASAVPWLDDAFGKLDKGFGYGFLNLIYSIGYAAGPIAAGVGLQSSGADLTYVLTAVLIVAAAVLMFLRRAAMPD